MNRLQQNAVGHDRDIISYPRQETEPDQIYHPKHAVPGQIKYIHHPSHEDGKGQNCMHSQIGRHGNISDAYKNSTISLEGKRDNISNIMTFISRTCDSCDSEQSYRNVLNSVIICDYGVRNNHSCNNSMLSKSFSANKRCNNVYRTFNEICHWLLLATLIVLRSAHLLVGTLIRSARLLVTSLMKIRPERPLVETLQRSVRLLAGSRHGSFWIPVVVLSLCCFQRCDSASKGELTTLIDIILFVDIVDRLIRHNRWTHQLVDIINTLYSFVKYSFSLFCTELADIFCNILPLVNSNRFCYFSS